MCVRAAKSQAAKKRVVAERAFVILLCRFSIEAPWRKVSERGQIFDSIRFC